jgi:hypothetical protein
MKIVLFWISFFNIDFCLSKTNKTTFLFAITSQIIEPKKSMVEKVYPTWSIIFF